MNHPTASPPRDTAAAEPTRYLPPLDGLRGIAILLVFLAHMIGLPLVDSTASVDGAVRALARFGWTGVDLFFVLSGFLITGILLETRGHPHYWRNYFARRTLRIVPLYYGALMLVFVVLPRLVHWTSPEYATLRANQVWYWTYTVNFLEVLKSGDMTPLNTAHLWSLSIEEQYYFFWPFIVLLASPRVLTRIAVSAAAFGLVFRTWLILTHPGHAAAAYVLTPGRLDGLMTGAILAVQMRAPGGLAAVRRAAACGLWMTGAALLGLALWQGGFDYHDAATAIIAYPVIAAFYGSVLVLALTGPASGALGRFLSGYHLRRWGKYSYGLYVVHFPLLGAVTTKLGLLQDRSLIVHGSHLPAVILQALIAVPLSYAVAWLSYNLYERRFLALKRYFARDGEGVSRAAAPVDEPVRDRSSRRTTLTHAGARAAPGSTATPRLEGFP